MKIGVIGSGPVGATLAGKLTELGHEVKIANSRGPESLTAMAAELGATPVSVPEATEGVEMVIVAIPTKAIPELSPELFAELDDDAVVVDTGNYHPELRDGRIDAIDEGTPDSEWVARQLNRPVVKAFNNVFATSLRERGAPAGTPGRIALSVAGDSEDAKSTVLGLIDDLGFDPIDGGSLDDSWRQQPGTPAYCQDLDAPALKAALAEAERDRVAEYRAAEEDRIKRAS